MKRLFLLVLSFALLFVACAPDNNMQYRQLGNTGIQVSVISLGCGGFPSHSQDSVNAVIDYAISQGINFIDIYDPNPEVRTKIGNALKGHRKKFNIQGHLGAIWEDGHYLRTTDLDKAKAGFEEQLRLLQTDHLDVGMIHIVDNEEDFHKIFDGEFIQWAHQLKKEGKIRCVGMSSHNPNVALMAVQTGLLDVIMFSLNPSYDMTPAGEDGVMKIDPVRQALYKYCENHGVGIDVMKTYAAGNLLNPSRSPFKQIMPPVQCIQYALSRPGVDAVMLGVDNISELQSALQWLTATDEEKDYSEILSSVMNASSAGQCMYCNHCSPCPVGIDIASVNKYYNLAIEYDSIPATVAEHYKQLLHHASECIECGACETRCPFGVHNIEQMRKAAQLFGY